MYTENTWHT